MIPLILIDLPGKNLSNRLVERQIRNCLGETLSLRRWIEISYNRSGFNDTKMQYLPGTVPGVCEITPSRRLPCQLYRQG